MSDFLTVKEFADMAGVSSQRIYKLISTNSNGLATDIQQYCKSIKGRKYIHSDALKLFNDDSTAVNEIQHVSAAELDNQNSLLQSELDVLKAETKALREQIADRDKTIESLQADKEYLKSKLNESDTERKALESSIDKLTTALTAAQALHGMDKQQAAIELNAEEQGEPEQKRSLFSRLFRRK